MTTKRIALYPGTFDPIHYGHIDIATRAAQLFDVLIVGVYGHPNKGLLFTAAERVRLAREALEAVPNIEVQLYNCLTVSFAQAVGANVLVRGLRVISDFELEYQMALTNDQLAPNLETICLMTRMDYAFVSSSIVKELFVLGADVRNMAPPVVLEAMAHKDKQLDRENKLGPPVVSLRD